MSPDIIAESCNDSTNARCPLVFEQNAAVVRWFSLKFLLTVWKNLLTDCDPLSREGIFFSFKKNNPVIDEHAPTLLQWFYRCRDRTSAFRVAVCGSQNILVTLVIGMLSRLVVAMLFVGLTPEIVAVVACDGIDSVRCATGDLARRHVFVSGHMRAITCLSAYVIWSPFT